MITCVSQVPSVSQVRDDTDSALASAMSVGALYQASAHRGAQNLLSE